MLDFLHKNKTDEELIVLYKNSSDVKYVGILFQRYTKLITAVAYKYLQNEHDTEDVTMDVFEILLKDLLTAEVSNVKGWLYVVTKNHSLKKIANRKRNRDIKENEKNFSDNFMEYQENSSLIDKEQQETEFNNLETAIKGLKEEQRICIELFYLQEKSYVEVADITGYELNKVKSYIQNGKRKLKIKLEGDE